MSLELLEIRKLIMRLDKLAKRQQFHDFLIQFRPHFEKFCLGLSEVADQLEEMDFDHLISRSSVPLAFVNHPNALQTLNDSIEGLRKLKKGDFWISDGHFSRMGKSLIRFLKDKKEKPDAIQALLEYFNRLLVF